jgi:hypothetical protein
VHLPHHNFRINNSSRPAVNHINNVHSGIATMVLRTIDRNGGIWLHILVIVMHNLLRLLNDPRK